MKKKVFTRKNNFRFLSKSEMGEQKKILFLPSREKRFSVLRILFGFSFRGEFGILIDRKEAFLYSYVIFFAKNKKIFFWIINSCLFSALPFLV